MKKIFSLERRGGAIERPDGPLEELMKNKFCDNLGNLTEKTIEAIKQTNYPAPYSTLGRFLVDTSSPNSIVFQENTSTFAAWKLISKWPEENENSSDKEPCMRNGYKTRFRVSLGLGATAGVAFAIQQQNAFPAIAAAVTAVGVGANSLLTPRRTKDPKKWLDEQANAIRELAPPKKGITISDGDEYTPEGYRGTYTSNSMSRLSTRSEYTGRRDHFWKPIIVAFEEHGLGISHMNGQQMAPTLNQMIRYLLSLPGVNDDEIDVALQEFLAVRQEIVKETDELHESIRTAQRCVDVNMANEEDINLLRAVQEAGTGHPGMVTHGSTEATQLSQWYEENHLPQLHNIDIKQQQAALKLIETIASLYKTFKAKEKKEAVMREWESIQESTTVTGREATEDPLVYTCLNELTTAVSNLQADPEINTLVRKALEVINAIPEIRVGKTDDEIYRIFYENHSGEKLRMPHPDAFRAKYPSIVANIVY